MGINNSQICLTGTELTGTAGGTFTQMTGSPLPQNPVIIIFDNQGTSSIQVSTDGVNTWRTFPGGEALVLDLRASSGLAPNFTFSIGTAFFIKGSGLFSISYVYAQNM